MPLSRFFQSFGVRGLAAIEKIYGKRITGLSLLELGKFLKWCESGLEDKPVIIGGWAVYSYIPKIGSIDIDFVLRKKDMERLVGLSVQHIFKILKAEAHHFFSFKFSYFPAE